jgi:hypothetical protein
LIFFNKMHFHVFADECLIDYRNGMINIFSQNILVMKKNITIFDCLVNLFG